MRKKKTEIVEFYYENIKQTTNAKEKLYQKLINSVFLVTIFYFLVCGTIFIFEKQKFQLYFTDNSYEYAITVTEPKPIENGTSIVYDTKYINSNIKSERDAINLIIEDSEIQKKKCANEKIKVIEDRMQKNYGIIAVNLCELDYDFALEIEKVFDTVYKEFPNISGYLSNLTLYNPTSEMAPIAVFKYAFKFSNASSGKYPWVRKNLILLNSSYFLSEEDFELALENTKRNNYFPKNVTNYSLVAHELGHYLSFIAINKYYGTSERFYVTKMNKSIYEKAIKGYNNGYLAKIMINEAYNSYIKENPDIFYSMDDFRASISQYAMAIDANGAYIYDETIAEAFHDYYLNGRDAADASIAIVNVLKKYL